MSLASLNRTFFWNDLSASIILIWLFYGFGIVGIEYWNRDLFLSLTPITLLVGFGLLLYHAPLIDRLRLGRNYYLYNRLCG